METLGLYYLPLEGGNSCPLRDLFSHVDVSYSVDNDAELEGSKEGMGPGAPKEIERVENGTNDFTQLDVAMELMKEIDQLDEGTVLQDCMEERIDLDLFEQLLGGTVGDNPVLNSSCSDSNNETAAEILERLSRGEEVPKPPCSLDQKSIVSLYSLPYNAKSITAFTDSDDSNSFSPGPVYVAASPCSQQMSYASIGIPSPVSSDSSDSDWAPAAKLKAKKGRPLKPVPYETKSQFPITNRKARKKDQNRNAALRYRQKKREEQERIDTEQSDIESRNKALKSTVHKLECEIGYLKSLMKELPELVSKAASIGIAL